MKFCSKCGKELDDGAVICPGCGCAVDSPAPVTNTKSDSGSFGWAVLGFFIPLVGLILYLVWKDEKPKCAKKAGIVALVGFICNILLYVLYVVLIALAAAAM